MSVKIFLPAFLFYSKENCDIYGEVQINENSSISYFIIGAKNFNASNNDTVQHKSAEISDSFQQLRHLGHIVRAGPASTLQRRDVSISFAFDAETPNIYLNRLNIKLSPAAHVNVFLYDAMKVLQLNDCMLTKLTNVKNTKSYSQNEASGDYITGQSNDINMLFQLLLQNEQNLKQLGNHAPTRTKIYCNIANYPLELMSQVFVLLMSLRPLVLLLRHTALYEHYQEWRKFRATGKRQLNIVLDKVLGIGLMMVLLFFIPHPGDYLIKTSHFIIRQLQVLLQALKGSPIGLKLNVHLNNFFLDCFNYHINLWATFLELIEPFVRQLFVPIALLGAMGLSYQLALLADLISVIGLHTHCFYIYAAVLFKVEIKGIHVLWKVVLGKRYNILKKRVESHNYMNRQLYLATIFFTSLLFLFPTILVYYIVFTTLRFCIYMVNLLLQLMRRQVLEFPLQLFYKWLNGKFYETESLQLQYESHAPSPLLQPDAFQMRMTVFNLNVRSSPLRHIFSCETGVLQELTTLEPTAIKNVLNRILKGTF